MTFIPSLCSARATTQRWPKPGLWQHQRCTLHPHSDVGLPDGKGLYFNPSFVLILDLAHFIQTTPDSLRPVSPEPGSTCPSFPFQWRPTKVNPPLSDIGHLADGWGKNNSDVMHVPFSFSGLMVQTTLWHIHMHMPGGWLLSEVMQAQNIKPCRGTMYGTGGLEVWRPWGSNQTGIF